MRHGIYIGANPKYKGQGALISKGKRGKVLVQFDDMENLFEKAHSWTEFLRKDFEVDPQEPEEIPCAYCGESSYHDLDCIERRMIEDEQEVK